MLRTVSSRRPQRGLQTRNKLLERERGAVYLANRAQRMVMRTSCGVHQFRQGGGEGRLRKRRPSKKAAILL